MKVKTKKQLKLPQFIEWVEKNRRFNESFGSNKYNYVHVNVDGVLEFTGEFCEDLFEVEELVEINYSTKIPKVLFENVFGDWSVAKDFQIVSRYNDYIEKVYLLNEDNTIDQLVYTKENGMVE
ncbi:hypothetical protein F10086_162 [Staphylococcus phage vB_SauM_JDF86]|nr:hypothetical protein F10086_162 [Staphylococcus phage vB_SauM_JDF86]